MTIIAIAFIIAVAALFVYARGREAFDEGYNGSTLIIGDVPDYVEDYVPPIVEARNPNGTFAKGHKPVGVVHGKGGRFVSAKAA
jgi:hypothetical protein